MFRSISSRSASRRFSTLASKNKKIYQDDIDFMEAQQHDIENEHDHRTLHWNTPHSSTKTDPTPTDASTAPLKPAPPSSASARTSIHHEHSSVTAASPLKRRSRRPTINCHVNSSDFSTTTNATNATTTSANPRHQEQQEQQEQQQFELQKNAMHDLHFQQAELSRKLAHRTHTGHTSHFAMDDKLKHGTNSSHINTNHTTRRISSANFSMPIHGSPQQSTSKNTRATVAAASLSTPPIAWYEALAHDGPGESMTQSEIHISQTSVLHSETTYVREYATSAKELLSLHVAKQEKKDASNMEKMKALTSGLKQTIQKNSLIADCVGGIVSKKDRLTLKNVLGKMTMKKGGGKLLVEHANRRLQLLNGIYQRKVDRRKTLDDSFSFGGSILHKMTNVLNTCTTRLAYREHMMLLSGLHASGLSTGRINSHQGSTPLHTKIVLSMDMTSETIELHDGNYTAIVTDGGGRAMVRIDGTSNSIDMALKAATTVLNQMEWSISFASDGPIQTNRRSDFHPWTRHLERELDRVHGRLRTKKMKTNKKISSGGSGGSGGTFGQGESGDGGNIGTEGVLRSLARVLDFMHPLQGTRLTGKKTSPVVVVAVVVVSSMLLFTCVDMCCFCFFLCMSGIVSKEPHRMEKILSNRCQLLGYGAFYQENYAKKKDITNDVRRIFQSMSGKRTERWCILFKHCFLACCSSLHQFF